jgi:hypothetical protein
MARYNKCQKDLDTARTNQENNDEQIEKSVEKLDITHEDMEEDSRISGFGVMNRKIRGAKEFICLANRKGDDSNKRKKLETLDQAEFLFIHPSP